MKNKMLGIFVGLLLFFTVVTPTFAVTVTATPSTNDDNRTAGWAHVNQLVKGVGETELEFVSTRSFASCFEYRTDGDTTQKTSNTNYNSEILDGLYPFICVNNQTKTKVITANEYVEVRMVFGAEKDERFDWTRFDVYPKPVVVVNNNSATVPTFAGSSTNAPVCSDSKPGNVANINVVRGVSDDTVEVQWALPTNASKAHILYWETGHSNQEHGFAHALLNTPNDGNEEIHLLKNGVNYTFAVAGVNGCMIGNFSRGFEQLP